MKGLNNIKSWVCDLGIWGGGGVAIQNINSCV